MNWTHWTTWLFVTLAALAGVELAFAVDDAIRDIRVRRAYKRGDFFTIFRNSDIKLRWQKRPARSKALPDGRTRTIIKFGVSAGYWPCLNAPYIEIAFWKTRFDIWYGLPSYKSGHSLDDDTSVRARITAVKLENK